MPRWFLVLLCVPLLAGAPKARKAALRIPVWMESRNGARDLKAADFSVKLEGRLAPVVAARGPDDDLLVLLVLDLSQQLSLAEVAKEALSEALAGLPGQAQVGLLRAQDGLQVLVDPTVNRSAVVEAVRAYPVSGKAGCLDTVETAGRLADSILAKAAVRLALLYITDSDVHNYREDFINPVVNSSDHHDMSRRFPEGLVLEKISKLETRLSSLAAPLLIVHLDYRSDRLNEAYQSGLMRLTAATGGSSAFCRTRADIPRQIAAVFRSIASHYSLDVEGPVQHSRIVSIEVDSGGRAASYRNRFVFGDK